MYAETYTLAKNEYGSPICTIQVGFSSGIPYLKYFGDISSRYIRSREKIPFIFSYLGRKLPQRKIRVGFSAENYQSDGTHLDLGVITGIYLAHNDVGVERKIYTFGEVDMNGVIKPVDGVEKLLWRLRNTDEKQLIFIPSDLEYFRKIYPALKIISVKNVISVFRYFEGSFHGKSTVASRSRINKWNDTVDLSILLTLLERGSVLIFDSDQYLSEDKVSKYSDLLDIDQKLTAQINSVLDPDYTIIGKNRSVRIVNYEKLEIFQKLSVPEDAKIILFLDRFNLSNCSKIQFSSLLDMVEDYCTLINIPECSCGDLYERCICSGSQLSLYKNRLSEIARRSYLVKEGVYDLEGDMQIMVDQDKNINKIEDIIDFDGVSKKKIRNLKKEIEVNKSEILEDL